MDMDTRRKISFYLNPENNAADKYVCDEIDKTPQGDRGKLWRAALLTGFAFRKQDSRLPNLIAELLNEHTTFDEMIQLMKAIFPDEMVSLGGGQVKERPITEQRQATPPAKPEQADETRDNARGLFGKPNRGG